jgi:type III pantothenate kinase
MILAIDIGNTNVVMGCIDENKIYFEARLSTNHTKTYEQYAVELKNIIELYDFDIGQIEGSIISCVVPPLTNIIRQAVKLVTKLEPLVVGPGVKTGLNIMTDNPGQLGSDLVVGAVAAMAQYSCPMIIFDLGTATTVSVIDENKTFLGGSIFPGVNISLEALTQRTSQLPKISLESPSKIIGTNTIDSMNSGIVLGNASMVDGMIGRIERETNRKYTVLATGGLAGLIAKHCEREVIYDPDLMIKGLLLIYRRNVKSKSK